MQPRHLARFRRLSDARWSPDGTSLVFVVTQMILDDDRYEGQLWLWDGNEARPVTSGHTDSRPRWAPEGSRIAFLRAQAERPKEPQVAVVDPGSGVAEVISAFPLGAFRAEWAPDGATLGVVAADWDEDWAGVDEEERARRPVWVQRARWHYDNLPARHDRRRHLYVLPATGGSPSLLTPGPFDETELAWHPDGGHIAVLSARHERAGIEPGSQAWSVPVEGGEAEQVVATGMWSDLSYGPDGALYVTGLADVGDYPDSARIYRVGGDGLLTDLTGHLDRSVHPLAVVPEPPGPRWLGDGSFLAPVEDDGRMSVYRFGPAGAEELIGGDRVVTGADPDGDGRIAFIASTPVDPGEVYVWEEGTERVITDLNGLFRAEVPLVVPEAFTFTSDDVEVTGWAYLPAGEGPVATLLNIHGGPASQYGWGFFDEFQVYAGAGYGVVACNPRGSSGRGVAFMRSVVGRWMEVEPPDMADLRRALEAAWAAFPRLDRDRVGVMGGSYGGFATLRLLALDQRFASAVVERAAASYVSFFGSSDIGPWFGDMYLGSGLPEGIDAHVAASATTHLGPVTTPTLVLHAENDWRCPVEQAEQVFTLLQAQGVPSAFLLFPAEGHEMSRSGRPRHRVERFDAILDWHRRHL